MLNIVKLFQGVAEPHKDDTIIRRVGINVPGTLIKLSPDELDNDLEAFGVFLLSQEFPVSTVAPDPRWATLELIALKADKRLRKVSSERDFYTYVRSSRTPLLIINDDISAKDYASMYIDPRDTKFREFLRSRAYLKTPIPTIQPQY